MFARIRHLASHTERYDTMARFYGTIFGMKQITTGLMDESSKANAERGHISDGVIGMALLAKRAGSGQRLDHFGFEVEDVREAVDRIDRFYPGSCIQKRWLTCPLPASRAQDPTGIQFDLAQKGQANVREGYADATAGSNRAGSITLPCAPASRKESPSFTNKILELKAVEAGGEAGSIMLTDGKVCLDRSALSQRLSIAPCARDLITSVSKSIVSSKPPRNWTDLAAAAFPECAAEKNRRRRRKAAPSPKDIQACPDRSSKPSPTQTVCWWIFVNRE